MVRRILLVLISGSLLTNSAGVYVTPAIDGVHYRLSVAPILFSEQALAPAALEQLHELLAPEAQAQVFTLASRATPQGLATSDFIDSRDRLLLKLQEYRDLARAADSLLPSSRSKKEKNIRLQLAINEWLRVLQDLESSAQSLGYSSAYSAPIRDAFLSLATDNTTRAAGYYWIRIQAIHALRHFPDGQTETALRELVMHGDDYIPQKTAFMLTQTGNPVLSVSLAAGMALYDIRYQETLRWLKTARGPRTVLAIRRFWNKAEWKQPVLDGLLDFIGPAASPEQMSLILLALQSPPLFSTTAKAGPILGERYRHPRGNLKIILPDLKNFLAGYNAFFSKSKIDKPQNAIEAPSVVTLAGGGATRSLLRVVVALPTYAEPRPIFPVDDDGGGTRLLKAWFLREWGIKIIAPGDIVAATLGLIPEWMRLVIDQRFPLDWPAGRPFSLTAALQGKEGAIFHGLSEARRLAQANGQLSAYRVFQNKILEVTELLDREVFVKRSMPLSGQTVRNLILMGSILKMDGYRKDFIDPGGIREGIYWYVHGILGLNVDPIVVSTESSTLVASYGGVEDAGKIFKVEQDFISHTITDPRLPLTGLSIAYGHSGVSRAAIEALSSAALVLAGPTSFYTNLVPLLQTEIAQSLQRNTDAVRIYIDNPVVDDEIRGRTLLDRIRDIERVSGKHFERLFDAIVFHDHERNAEGFLENVLKMGYYGASSPTQKDIAFLERKGLAIIRWSFVRFVERPSRIASKTEITLDSNSQELAQAIQDTVAAVKQQRRMRRIRAAFKKIMKGSALSASLYAKQFKIPISQAAEELEWLADLKRETDGTGLGGVDRVLEPSELEPLYRRVAISPKIQGTLDMRGEANLYWSPKVCFYVGLAIGYFLKDHHLDGAFNITASHNPSSEDGLKWAVQDQRNERASAYVGSGIRSSSQSIQSDLMEGLRASGVDVFNLGTTATPETYFALALQPAGQTLPESPSPEPDGHPLVLPLNAEEVRSIYRWMPSEKEPENLFKIRSRLEKATPEHGNYSALEIPSNLIQLRTRLEIHMDNKFARAHNVWVEAVARLGPDIIQSLFDHWVNQKKEFGELMRLLSETHWPEGPDAVFWNDFKFRMEIPEDRFAEQPFSAVAHPLRSMGVVGTDFANGSNFRKTFVIQDLGATAIPVSVTLRNGEVADTSRPDPSFPVHEFPNPQEPENQVEAIALAKQLRAPVVLFDDDGDRLFVVDEEGHLITGEEMSALLAPYFSGPILTDVRCPQYVLDIFSAAGRELGKAILRGPVGYATYIETAHTIQEAFENGQASVRLYPNSEQPLEVALDDLREPVAYGIEASGHAFFRANGYANDASFYMGVVLWMLAQVRKEGESLAKRHAAIFKTPASPEVRILLTPPIAVPERRLFVQEVLHRLLGLHDFTFSIDRTDGGLIEWKDPDGNVIAKGLVRNSNNEPVLGLVFEGRSHKDKQALENIVFSILADTEMGLGDGRAVRVDFSSNRTSLYVKRPTTENNSENQVYPPVLERIQKQPSLWGSISDAGRQRIESALRDSSNDVPGSGVRKETTMSLPIILHEGKGTLRFDRINELLSGEKFYAAMAHQLRALLRYPHALMRFVAIRRLEYISEHAPDLLPPKMLRIMRNEYRATNRKEDIDIISNALRTDPVFLRDTVSRLWHVGRSLKPSDIRDLTIDFAGEGGNKATYKVALTLHDGWRVRFMASSIPLNDFASSSRDPDQEYETLEVAMNRLSRMRVNAHWDGSRGVAKGPSEGTVRDMTLMWQYASERQGRHRYIPGFGALKIVRDPAAGYTVVEKDAWAGHTINVGYSREFGLVTSEYLPETSRMDRYIDKQQDPALQRELRILAIRTHLDWWEESKRQAPNGLAVGLMIRDPGLRNMLYGRGGRFAIHDLDLISWGTQDQLVSLLKSSGFSEEDIAVARRRQAEGSEAELLFNEEIETPDWSWIEDQCGRTAQEMLKFILAEGDLPPVTILGAMPIHILQNMAAAWMNATSTSSEIERILRNDGFDEITQPQVHLRAYSREVGENREQLTVLLHSLLEDDSSNRPQESVFRLPDCLRDHYYEIVDLASGKILLRQTGVYLNEIGLQADLKPGQIRGLVIRDAGEISQLGHPSQHVPAKSGAITASRSYNNPPYWYHWIRDSALFMKTLSHMYSYGHPMLDLDALKVQIDAWVSFTTDLSGRAKETGRMGDAHWQVNGENYPLMWNDPQYDGWALTVTALVDYAQALRAHEPGTGTDQRIRDHFLPLIQNLVHETIAHADAQGFDPWEESFGLHLYTRLAQHRALRKAILFSRKLGETPDSRWIESERDLKEAIQREHVKSIDEILRDLREQAHLRGEPKNLQEVMALVKNASGIVLPAVMDNWDGLMDAVRHKTELSKEAINLYSEIMAAYRLRFELLKSIGKTGLADFRVLVSTVRPWEGRTLVWRAFDSSVIGAIIHSADEHDEGDTFLAGDDPVVMMTLAVQERMFRFLYPINLGRGPNDGLGIGRYAGDLYDGGSQPLTGRGNPWFLTTAWFGRAYFYLARALAIKGVKGLPHLGYRNRRARLAYRVLFGRKWITGAAFEKHITALAKKRAVGYIGWIEQYGRNGRTITEQIDAATGAPRGAEGLGWSFRELNRLLNDWLRSHHTEPVVYPNIRGEGPFASLRPDSQPPALGNQSGNNSGPVIPSFVGIVAAICFSSMNPIWGAVIAVVSFSSLYWGLKHYLRAMLRSFSQTVSSVTLGIVILPYFIQSMIACISTGNGAATLEISQSSQPQTQPFVNWLVHQMDDKSWVASFEVPAKRDLALDKVDPNAQDYLKDMANTYDQALASLVFLKTGDISRAGTILDRFQDMGVIPPASNKEKQVRSGEILWVGIAAAQFSAVTGNHQRFEPLMSRLDDYIRQIQFQDGPVKGGPDLDWISTEHNWDALVYLIMRSRLRPEQADVFKKTARQIARWLVQEAYLSDEGFFRRGAHDRIFATDVQSWGILALTAVKSMDPDFFRDSGLDVIDGEKLLTAVEKRAWTSNRALSGISGYDYGDLFSPVGFEWSEGVAGAYKALGHPEKAAQILKALEPGIQAKDGRRSLPYAAVPGKTFSLDGQTAPAFPSVASTAWWIFDAQFFNPFLLPPIPREDQIIHFQRSPAMSAAA